MKARVNLLTTAGRVLLALIFVLAGFAKFGAPGGTATQMASHGIPAANVLVWGVVAIELVGGLMLLTGLFTRCVALAFAIYLLVLAVMFHAYWGLPADQARVQHAAFFEHIAMIGGMLYVVAFGAGAWSLDALMGRRT
jgi:putative oxidoreductase